MASNIASKLPGGNETRVFYLSVPDSAHVGMVDLITQHAMPAAGTARFVIEKPFGSSLRDCLARQQALERHGLQSGQIWRLDHYLGKRGVRGLLDFRQQNPAWEAKWSREHIKLLEVVVQESEDVADRIDFYAETGVVRDMMVNHMMELFATATMEFPSDWANASQVPEQRARLLESVAPIQRQDILLAQYAEYAEHYAAHFERSRGARQIPDGDKAPTLGYARLRIPNPRWEGVDFAIVHAKAVDVRRAYVRVAFRDGAELLFHIQGGKGNEFIAIKQSSLGMQMDGWQQADSHGGQKVWMPTTKALQAYEVLLGDAIKGDDSYFVTFGEVIAGYRAWDSVMDFVPIPGRYPKGADLHSAVVAAARAAAESQQASGSLCSVPEVCAPPIIDI